MKFPVFLILRPFFTLFIIQMNYFLNKSIRYCLKSLPLFTSRVHYRFSAQGISIDALRESFQKKQDMTIFNDLIEKSNNSLDNINYFKIFQILEDNHSPVKHYEDFFHLINSTITKKSDNIRMLLAKVKGRIAKKHEQDKNYQDTIDHIDQALGVLEDSLVPPLLLYYQMYRYYGHMQNQVGNKKQALQALSESVGMIEKYLEHSDDPMTSNQNCRSQAKAYNALVQLQPQKSDEWLKKANEIWEDYVGNRYESEEFADTVIHNARKEYKHGKEKGHHYVIFNLHQFKQEAIKERLNSLKKQYEK